MAKLSAAEELVVAIRSAAMDADPRTTSFETAKSFYRSHPDVVQPFVSDWVIQRLAGLIGKQRSKTRREANEQLMFEESLGFKRLPARIRLEGKPTIKREDATITVFRKLASQLRAREDPALVQVNDAIALMAKYTTRDKDITWAEVVRREAEVNAGKRRT